MKTNNLAQATLATGILRWIFIGLGWFFLGIAVLGALLPGLPTTIWVIIAAYFFSRSSPRLHGWLWNSRWFGPLLRDWHTHRGMRRRAKITAITLMAIACSCSILFADIPDWVRIVIACCGCIGVFVVSCVVRTVPEDLDIRA